MFRLPLRKKYIAMGIILVFVGSCFIPTAALDFDDQPTSRGNWLYVGGSGPGNYTKIQDAINASSDGDTVVVYDDSSPYYENVVVTKSITVVGENKKTTIIDGSCSDDVVNVSAAMVTIAGFTIQNAGGSDYAVGISVFEDNCTIMECNITNNDFGIWLFDSDNTTISSVTVKSYSYGIQVGDVNENNPAHYVIITNNVILDSPGWGVNINDNCLEPLIHNNSFANCYIGVSVFCDNATVSHNIFHNTSVPIYLSSSSGTTITNNTMDSNRLGSLEMQFCRNCIISNNEFSECGIWIHGGDLETYQHTISPDNQVNGKPVYYFFNEDIDIDGGEIGQLIFVKCSGIVANVSISHTSHAIQLAHCTNLTIRNSSIHHNGYGINFEYSDKNTVEYMEISNNTRGGCNLEIQCSHNQIIKNTFSWNGWGIYISLSDNNVIMGNRFDTNTEKGIYLDMAPHNIIADNIITDSIDGLCVGYSENNTIIRNTIKSNTQYGIHTFGSWNNENNTIYHNNFEDNTMNAFTMIGDNNTWDNGYPSGGNYWDDYTGTDADGDGIGDIPYQIPGTEGEDNYPLMEPFATTYLEIGRIFGGLFTIKADVKNNGDYTATGVHWTIEVAGKYEPLRNWSGDLQSIPPGDSERISTGLLLGLGRYKITVTAEARNAETVTKTLDGFIFLFIILIQQ